MHQYKVLHSRIQPIRLEDLELAHYGTPELYKNLALLTNRLRNRYQPGTRRTQGLSLLPSEQEATFPTDGEKTGLKDDEGGEESSHEEEVDQVLQIEEQKDRRRQHNGKDHSQDLISETRKR